MLRRLIGLTIFLTALTTSVFAVQEVRFWDVQSVDTMKYSRDLAREKMNDRSFDAVIERQIGGIAAIGATHVAIATPYDAEFLPFLRRWVSSARRHGLKVWFRGNLSGWEGWFDYPKISRQDHRENTKKFILGNKGLFEDGDIFTACMECENGGPGDPRFNGDVRGHREFLISEHKMMADAFKEIDKDVVYNYNSMNGDVASLVMNDETTLALGGVITVDHYVKTKERMLSDIREWSGRGGGAKIVIGEFGAPIPDIHGKMSEIDQAKWIQDVLIELAKEKSVIAVNYWVSTGGSTEAWSGGGRAKAAVGVLDKFFKPPVFSGRVVDEFGNPVKDAIIQPEGNTYLANPDGYFEFPYIRDADMSFTVTKEGYDTKFLSVSPENDGQTTMLHLTNLTFWSMLLKAVRQMANMLTVILGF